jgi:hypothetical protein
MMRKLLSILCLFAGLGANAQQARVKTYTAPLAGTSVLRDVDDKYGMKVFSAAPHQPDGNAEAMRLAEIKKEIARKYPYRKKNVTGNKSSQALSPVVLSSFKADSFPGLPPDNYMAISQNNAAISTINSSIAVLDATTGMMAQRKSLYSFTSSVGLPSTFNNVNYRYDPKVMYDPEADRFITVILNGVNQHNWIIFGFSQTNDPTGGWNFYKLYGDYAADSTWFDYPTIAMTHGEFFLTGNKITYNGSWQAGFRQSVIYQVRKEDGYNGAAAITYNLWDSIALNNNMYIRNIFPVKGGAGPHGPGMYFVSNRNLDVQNDTILLLKVTDTIGSTNTNLTVTTLQSNLSYGVPPDARQDTSTFVNVGRLTTNDGRILGAYVENNEIQFVSTTVDPVTGSSGVYHGTITDVLNNPAVTANIFSIDTIDFGYPNISYAGNQGSNTSIISFDYSGPHTFPGLGAIYYDGTQFSGLLKVKEGVNVIDEMAGLQRWGDYTGSQPYYSTIGKVWIEGIYGRADKQYGLWMAEIGTNAFTGLNNNQKVTASERSVYPNPALQFIQLEFTMATESVLEFTIYDMQGRKVDKMNSDLCKKGKNKIQFNIASLAPGNYILKGTDAKGQTMMSDKFIKQ